MALHKENDIEGKPLSEHRLNEACAKLLEVIGAPCPQMLEILLSAQSSIRRYATHAFPWACYKVKM